VVGPPGHAAALAELTRPAVLSDRALRRLARIKYARREHLQAHGREPSTVELAVATELSREQVESLIAVERTSRGLAEPVSGEDGPAGTFEDLLPDPVAEHEYERVVERMEIQQVRDLSGGLDERERPILHSHYASAAPPRRCARSPTASS
jgi:RNA polymerase primary sigma factor